MDGWEIVKLGLTALVAAIAAAAACHSFISAIKVDISLLKYRMDEHRATSDKHTEMLTKFQSYIDRAFESEKAVKSTMATIEAKLDRTAGDAEKVRAYSHDILSSISGLRSMIELRSPRDPGLLQFLEEQVALKRAKEGKGS